MTKLRDYFDEMVVYKDLRNNSFFSSLGLPAFLRDYLLKTFSDEYGNFDMQQVSAFVKKYIPKKEDWMSIKNRIVYENQQVQLLTRISIDINIKTGEISFAIPDFGVSEKETMIEPSIWETYKDELVKNGETWGIIKLGYRPPDDTVKPRLSGKIKLVGFKNFCPYTDAINQRKKISFQKIEYNIKKERILHHGGERYTFSPYSLVWDGDNYYIVGYSDKYQAIGSHRVDRIAACPCILDESAVPQPVGFDVSKYIKTTFRMYNAPRAEVELLCDNSVMDAIIDRFGPDVQTYAGDLQNFRVIEEIAVGKVFFNWIFGFEGKVRIKGPESVKKQYREMVMSAMNLV